MNVIFNLFLLLLLFYSTVERSSSSVTMSVKFLLFGRLFCRDTHRRIDYLVCGDASSLVPVRDARLDTSDGFIDRYSRWSDTAKLLR